jgi:four helix bundle protein
MAKDFRELRVWEEAMRLAESIYSLSNAFPKEEKYGLTAQLRRAAVSIPSCIAEGNARGSTRDYLRFISMVQGSLAEVETQLALAVRLKFVNLESAGPAQSRCRAIAALLQALRKSLNIKIADKATASLFPVPRSRSS